MKDQNVNALTIIVGIVALIQGLVPTMPIQNPQTATIISAVLMFLATILTVWKQYGSDEIRNNATTPILIVAGIAIVGGLNDLFAVFPMSETASQWVRFGITAATAILNFFSKIMYPTPETKSKI